MNILIFVLKEDRTNKKQFDDFKVLLKQFNYLPCEKLMVCRQPDYAHTPTAASKEKKRLDGIAFTRDILDRSGMSMPFTLCLDGTSQEANISLNKISTLIKSCPRVPLGDCSSLKTVSEWRLFVSNLLDKKTRVSALREQLKRFSDSVRYHERWRAAHVVIGIAGEVAALYTLGASGLGTLTSAGMIYVTDAQIKNINIKEQKATQELESNHVDEDLFRETVDELDGIERLAQED
ncbi:unnamed protein product [Ascophyllum nodosum]